MLIGYKNLAVCIKKVRVPMQDVCLHVVCLIRMAIRLSAIADHENHPVSCKCCLRYGVYCTRILKPDASQHVFRPLRNVGLNTK
jgi:hypothetical protein